jgi:hypothetical protein
MISSSSGETMSTAQPSSRFCTIRLWMYSIEPTSKPAGWLRSNKQFDRARKLSGDDDFFVDFRLRAFLHRLKHWGCDIKIFDQFVCIFKDLVFLQYNTLCKRRFVVGAQNRFSETGNFKTRPSAWRSSGT